MRRLAAAATFVAALAIATVATAGPIKYGAPGTVNAASYSFTAVADGEIWAYFVGQTAGFGSDIGLSINGAAPLSYGLQNHSSARGDSYLLGTVQAGDTLVFELRVSHAYDGPPPLEYSLFSNQSLNPAGEQHIYSYAYAFDSADSAIPGGTYIGFEDISPLSGGDRDYDDHEFVFTNVAVVTTPDGGSTLALLGAVMSGIALLRRKRE